VTANVRAQLKVVPVYRPENGVELALAQSVLEAHGIPHFVHNAGFGGLYPGMQIELYNVRTIMVPEAALEAARDLLAHFVDRHDEPVDTTAGETERLSGWERVRLIAELILFGWCVPPVKRRRF
jgi:hypothetical protein